MFDIGLLDTVTASNDGADMQLRHPTTNAPTGTYIRLLGKDSDSYRAQQRRNANEYLRNDSIARAKGKAANNKSAEELEDDMVTLLVACSVGWYQLDDKGNKLPVSFGGAELSFTAENVRMVYIKRPWVRDQVKEFVDDLANFMKG